ncbi:XRE family transcriptional regulator [Vibrio parahaemolyticus]|nr:XRE family transcriptional regulator [Vibrio parahaemolyticus]EJR2787958.1 XRE family transcriptional regulator [Vibrio parahaemolyticus]
MKKELLKENKITIMRAIRNIVSQHRLKQREVAEILDIKQPRASDLLNFKYKRFSLDILLEYLSTFGFTMVIEPVVTVRGKPVRAKFLKNTTIAA